MDAFTCFQLLTPLVSFPLGFFDISVTCECGFSYCYITIPSTLSLVPILSSKLMCSFPWTSTLQ